MSSAEVRPNRDVQRTRQRASLRKGSRSSTVRDDLPRAGVNLLRHGTGAGIGAASGIARRSSFQLRSSSYGGQVGCPFSGRCAPCVEPFLRVLHPSSAKAVVRRLRHGTGAGIGAASGIARRSSFQLRSSSYGGQVGCPFSGRCAPCVEPFLRVLHPSSAKAVVRRLRHGTGAGIRTQDRRFRKPMLYPTELRPHPRNSVG